MKNLIIILIVAFMEGCSTNTGNTYKTAHVARDSVHHLPNTHFKIVNGVAYYNNQLFTGTAVELFPSGTVAKSVGYLNGLEDNFTTTYYPTGKIES
jgi:antitoxin component YwqK of YwqJK toxin-antitoxin module